MAEVIIHGGYTTLVDDADLDLVLQYLWWAHQGKHTTYVRGCRRGTRQPRFYLHRLMMGVNGRTQVDHDDGNGLNNQRSNLRVATNQQNAMNRGPSRSSLHSQYKGVTWSKRAKLWVAQLGNEGLGYFHDEVEAARAYDAVVRERYGEFAYLNFEEVR